MSFIFQKVSIEKKEFTKDHVNGAVAAIFKHVTRYLSVDSVHTKETYRVLADALGFEFISHDIELESKSFWFDRAATFQFCPYGSCAWRASYAAVKIAKIFQNSDLKIYVKSAETKDQFTVMVGNKNRGWFVYDPLTNPDVFFPVELFNKKVVGTFSDRRPGASQFCLQITPDLLEEYSKIWPRLQKLYLQQCANTVVTVKSLLNDPAFLGGLKLGQVKPSKYNEVCKRAIEIFKDLVSKQLQEK